LVPPLISKVPLAERLAVADVTRVFCRRVTSGRVTRSFAWSSSTSPSVRVSK
jgi:hypothetical protein